MGTGQNLAVQEMAANGEIDIVSYQSEIMENYSCCRMVAQTKWINENPNTVKAVLRALLRAQSYYEANKEEAVKLHAAAIEATEEYVAAYMMDDEHYFVSADPLKDGVVRAWDILDKTGYIRELEASDDEDAEDRISNIDELLSKAAYYEETHEEATLSEFLEEVALVADIDNVDGNDNRVLLMTLHSAKGLEFPQLYLAGMEDGLFPSYMSITSDNAME